MARIVRRPDLAIKGKEFIEAGPRIGRSRSPAIILRHILPNVIGPWRSMYA